MSRTMPGVADQPIGRLRRGLHIVPTAASCDHRLWGAADGLPCVQPLGHAGGHVYHDPTGSYVLDRHRDGGHG